MKINVALKRILFVAVALIVVALLSLNIYAKWRMDQEIDKLAVSKSDRLYTIHVGGTYLDIWNGVFKAFDIEVRTDTSVWASIHQQWPDSFPLRMELSAASLNVRRFGVLSFLQNKTASVKAIIINDPVIDLVQQRDTAVEKSGNKQPLMGLPARLSAVAKSLEIDDIFIRNAHISIQNIEKQDTLRRSFAHLNLSVEDIRIDSASTETTFCKEIALQTGRYESSRTSGNQIMAFDSLEFSRNARSVSLQAFSMTPKLSEADFFKQQPFRKAYMSFSAPAIKISGLSLDTLLENKYLYADSVRMENGKLNISSSRFLPLPYQKPLPQDLIEKIKIPFNFENIVVINSDIEVMTRLPGEDYLLTFNHAYVSAHNFTNDSSLMDDAHPVEIWAEAKFMDRAPLQLKMQYPLLSPTLRVDYTATMQDFPITALNPIVQNKNVNIKSGHMQTTVIACSVRNGIANGTVKIEYDDLKVELLREDNGKTRKVMTKLIDLLVREESAPRDKNAPASAASVSSGTISYTRFRQEDFFVFLWHSIQTGLIPAIVPSFDRLKGIMPDKKKKK